VKSFRDIVTKPDRYIASLQSRLLSKNNAE